MLEAEDMTNRCGNPNCNRPFGLIRFSWRFEQFCSNKCRENYKRQLERNTVYRKRLYKHPEPSVAEQRSWGSSVTGPEREMSFARQELRRPQSHRVPYGDRAGRTIELASPSDRC